MTQTSVDHLKEAEKDFENFSSSLRDGFQLNDTIHLLEASKHIFASGLENTEKLIADAYSQLPETVRNIIELKDFQNIINNFLNELSKANYLFGGSNPKNEFPPEGKK